MSDGTNQVLSVLSASSSGSEGTVQGTYVSAEGSQPAYLIFDTSSYEFMGMLAIADDAPFEVNAKPGDQFIVDLISITPEGEVTVTPLADTPLTFGVEPFKFYYAPAQSGNYEVGLTIGDLAGNSQYQKVAIAINNEGVDGTLRGYTDTNEGVYFQYPYAWGESYSFTNDDGTLTNTVSDDAGIQALYVDAYPETDAQTALDSVLSLVDAEVSEVTESTLGGLPAYAASYVVELEDGGTSNVTVASVFNEASGSAVVFTLQSADPSLDEAVIGVLDGTLTFFAPRLE